jgi:4-hydroxy-tetrahydrodipicolinate synthase
VRFRSDPAKIRGSIAPVVSPFTADGAPDTEAGQATVLRLLAAGASVLEGPVAKVAQ